MRMISERHIDTIQRLGGCACLDFVNTVHRRPAEPGDEYLHTLEDYLSWAGSANLLPVETIEALGRQAGARADNVLRALVELRELLYRIFLALAEGGEPARADLAAFETRAREARDRQRLTFSGGRARWCSSVPKQSDITLADAIVLDADKLLTGERLDRVKQCQPGEGCGWLFLDTTKNRSRRWCSMETCGSAAKARAWYRRHRMSGD